jgi:Holliday junction resolvase RusA-like endonuclease
MEFTLYYKGLIRSKATISHKQVIRAEVHKQLLELWKLPPLDKHQCWLKDDSRKNKLRNSDRRFRFLVTKQLRMYVDLRVQFLVPPKSRSFKDIDNKLKTLFDSLRVPGRNEIPRGWRPKSSERPLVCLLEDDELIYKVDIDTDYLLDSNAFHDENHMICLINVKIKGNTFDEEYGDLIV